MYLATRLMLYFQPGRGFGVVADVETKMYAVIFRAKLAQSDDAYFHTAKRMRELALGNYGCVEFVSVREGDEEVAISYWENETQILNWKKDPEHVKAQQLGRSRWYGSWSVEVCKIDRAYSSKG
jgi:heme-degrading monooxygenase HmoA